MIFRFPSKGEQIAQKADTARTEACHTPTCFVNLIGEAVTNLRYVKKFSEIVNEPSIASGTEPKDR